MDRMIWLEQRPKACSTRFIGVLGMGAESWDRGEGFVVALLGIARHAHRTIYFTSATKKLEMDG